MMERAEIFTIGHSTMEMTTFIDRLRSHDISDLVDVRSSPYSRYCSQFDRQHIRTSVYRAKMRYTYLGQALGGRPKAAHCYNGHVADYEIMAKESSFTDGIKHLLAGAMRGHKICLMCSESSPCDCHRCLLVGRALSSQSVVVKHIMGDNKIATQSDIEELLLQKSSMTEPDLFASRDEQLSTAYRKHSMQVAYSLKLMTS
ncbi:DUF488 domain-containing protein [Thalassospira xiamenensis]|uniref:DUF488 domain-containing protein n=1 Tax=Thalassospira xiamenensis TaxID=220697 RepID=A0A285TTZ5_9PROT|nr:Protein of unknown function, DUF488 [Thalassospira xiamenensis]